VTPKKKEMGKRFWMLMILTMTRIQFGLYFLVQSVDSKSSIQVCF